MAIENPTVVAEKNDTASKPNIFDYYLFEKAPVGFFDKRVSTANKGLNQESSTPVAVAKVVFGGCTI